MLDRPTKANNACRRDITEGEWDEVSGEVKAEGGSRFIDAVNDLSTVGLPSRYQALECQGHFTLKLVHQLLGTTRNEIREQMALK